MDLKQHVVYFIPHRVQDATAGASGRGGLPARMQRLARQGAAVCPSGWVGWRIGAQRLTHRDAAACPSGRLERSGALRERDAGTTRGESGEGIDDGLH